MFHRHSSFFYMAESNENHIQNLCKITLYFFFLLYYKYRGLKTNYIGGSNV